MDTGFYFVPIFTKLGLVPFEKEVVMFGTIVLTLLTVFRIILPVLLLFLLGELVRRHAEKRFQRKGTL